MTGAGGYLIGSVPWAYVIGRWHGIDIRCHGSGNVGATNVSRVLGRKWGVTCFLLDFAKGLLPVGLVRLALETRAPGWSAGAAEGLLLVAVFAPVIGHNWSVFLGFRGGKGVAVSAGALMGLSPWAVLICLGLWLVVFETSRIVSLASILAAVALPVAAWGLTRTGRADHSPLVLLLLAALALLVVARHRTNLQRLLAGTEPRFVRKNEDEPTSPDPASRPEPEK